MKTLRIILSAVAATVIFPGCYTQFVMVDKAPPQPTEQITYEIDSATGDTVKVVKQTDTVHTRDHQTCIWERDLMGYPRLYCYDSFYPRDWLYYNYSPWWYDSYPYYSGGYHYNGRRHYTHYYEREYDGNNSTSRSEPAGASGSAYRARTRGIPDESGQPLSGRSSSTASPVASEKSATIQQNEPAKGQIIIPSSNEQAPRITRERSAGVPSSGSAVPSQPQTSDGSRSASSSTPPPSSPPPQIQSGNSAPSPQPASQPSQSSDEGRKQRRNPRSW